MSSFINGKTVFAHILKLQLTHNLMKLNENKIKLEFIDTMFRLINDANTLFIY